MNCGADLMLRCTNCQAELLPGARFCMHCGQAIRVLTPADDARLARLTASTPPPLAEKVRLAAHLAGERRYVTVLFIDVVGSTGLAEELDVEVWSVLMNGAFDRIAPVIYRYEGTVARMLGDSLVAFFGAPVAHEDDPLRAVMAALDVIEVVQEYASFARQQYGVEFAMRACLNYGLVMLGTIGKDLKYDFTSLGGVINLAARLKFAAQPMSVLIADTVHRFVAPVFECLDLGFIEVKGRSEPVRAYQVLGYKAEPGSLRGLVGLASPMVGRDGELYRLTQLCETVRAGLGRAVLIIGEPGMGKTRLISEWQAAVVRKAIAPNVQWAEGHSHSYAQGLVYHLLVHLVYSLLGVSESVGEARIHAALLSLVEDLFGSSETSPGLDVYASLAHLLSLKLHGNALEAMDQVEIEALPIRYAFALRSLIERLALRRPVILVLEDLHWADPSSVQALIKLLPAVSSAQVLFCMVIRPERESPGWKLVTAAREVLGNSLYEISLEALSDQDTRQLVANLLAIEALPDELRALILRKSEGNPYFVEEIIRMLIERGAIVAVDNGWVAGESLGSIVVPDNLQGLLMARIDRLPDESRHTLRVASVVGRQFPVRVLEWVLADGGVQEVGTPGAISVLSSLENAGLVHLATVEPDLEYNFRHTLVQEAAYASLLIDDRKQLHLAVGHAVESLYPNRLEENAAVLARHYYEAGDQALALHYFILAGRSALSSFANQEAEGHHRMALSLVRLDSERAELLSGLGLAISRQGRIQEGIQFWMEAIALYQSLKDYDGIARLYSRVARASWHGGDTPAGLRYCQEGLVAVQGAPESPEQARLIHETARAYYFNGMPDRADQLCRQALELAERLGALEVQADTLATMEFSPISLLSRRFLPSKKRLKSRRPTSCCA
jgi:class 3 adenylate cyclase/tetratricopeptide (TPR) repeat protein